jgi:hypothetical protein
MPENRFADRVARRAHSEFANPSSRNDVPAGLLSCILVLMKTSEPRASDRLKLILFLVGATAVSLIGSASILTVAVYIH